MDCIFRNEARTTDTTAVGELVADTGFFRPDEVEVAVELVAERLANGDASGYHFRFADDADGLAGYVCYGPVPCTVGSFDLYWIVVHRRCQGSGLGRKLAALAEESAKAMGGRLMYVETAGKEQYRSTRAFYEKIGYTLAAELPDFYEIGDAKIIYQKKL